MALMTQTVDVIVLGGGPGGLSAATVLALRGRDVVIVNHGPLMGYGIEGAFKSKAAFEIARQYAQMSLRPDLFDNQSTPSFDKAQRNITLAAEDLRSGIEARLQRLGIKFLEGRGRFADPKTIVVGEETLLARHIVIATGSVPRVFPGVTVDSQQVLTSDEVVGLISAPKSLLILGAGVIGCEFANIFNEMGSDVQLVDTQPRILSNEDEDLSGFLTRAFGARGIDVVPSSRFETLEVTDDGVRTTLSDGRHVHTDSVLFAVGRSANTGGLGLEVAGVATDERGYIPINAEMKTNVPHIYAVGDVGQRNTPTDLALVHVAEAEGRCAAYNILGEKFTQNLEHVPYIIFTIPMIAGAGLNEMVARERYGAIRVGKYPYGRSHRAHAAFPPLGFVKLIVGPDGDDRILGIRAIGRDADGLVAAASIMIEQGLPYTYILDSIMPHPSIMECLQGAAHIVAGDALSYEEGEEFLYNYLIDEPAR